MSIEKRSLEILKAGLDDTFYLMDEEAMDMIEGGRCFIFNCAAYTQNDTPAPTPQETPEPSPSSFPSNPPVPTCECGADCICRTCGCI